MRGYMLTFQTSQSVRGNEAMMTWKTPLFTRTCIHTCSGTARHLGPAQPLQRDCDSGGHVWWISALQFEVTSWVSCSHHQTNPNSSFVYCTSSTAFPGQGFNDSSSTLLPGGVKRQPNRTNSAFGIFFFELNLIFPFLLFLLSYSCWIPLDHPWCLFFKRVDWNFPTWFGLWHSFESSAVMAVALGSHNLRFRHIVGPAICLITPWIL